METTKTTKNTDYIAGMVIGTVIAGLISAISVYSSKQEVKIEIPRQDNTALVEIIKALSGNDKPQETSTSNAPSIRVNSPETYTITKGSDEETGASEYDTSYGAK